MLEKTRSRGTKNYKHFHKIFFLKFENVPHTCVGFEDLRWKWQSFWKIRSDISSHSWQFHIGEFLVYSITKWAKRGIKGWRKTCAQDSQVEQVCIQVENAPRIRKISALQKPNKKKSSASLQAQIARSTTKSKGFLWFSSGSSDRVLWPRIWL